MDGTLINTETMWRYTVVETLKEYYQCELLEEEVLPYTGCTTNVVCVRLAQRFPEALIDSDFLADEITNKMMQRSPNAELMPGALELLEFIDSHGGQIAIASSSALSVIDKVIAAHDLPVSVRASSYEAQRSKPHPLVFELAALRLGCPVEQCIAWEDSLNGAISAYAAGMKVIVVPQEPDLTKQQFSFASEVHCSLHESLSWLKEQFLVSNHNK